MNKYKTTGKYSYSLINRPSFIEGMASLFDFQKAKNKYAIWRNMSGARNSKVNVNNSAIASDWFAIGEDIKFAIKNYKNER